MKPILFSTEMVRAILSDRKTMTRRVIKDKDITNWFDIDVDGKPIAYIDQATGDSYPPTIRARYQIGDILWVRETWGKKDGHYFYKAGHELLIDSEPLIKRWHPSIHMPREAARIFLKVTNVKVERLQDITEEDALKEGAKAYGPNNCSGTSARIAFAELWDGVYNNWRENPWVFVYEFERVSEDV
jgi:hypothetical protein